MYTYIYIYVYIYINISLSSLPLYVCMWFAKAFGLKPARLDYSSQAESVPPRCERSVRVAGIVWQPRLGTMRSERADMGGPKLSSSPKADTLAIWPNKCQWNALKYRKEHWKSRKDFNSCGWQPIGNCLPMMLHSLGHFQHSRVGGTWWNNFNPSSKTWLNMFETCHCEALWLAIVTTQADGPGVCAQGSGKYTPEGPHPSQASPASRTNLRRPSSALMPAPGQGKSPYLMTGLSKTGKHI